MLVDIMAQKDDTLVKYIFDQSSMVQCAYLFDHASHFFIIMSNMLLDFRFDKAKYVFLESVADDHA